MADQPQFSIRFLLVATAAVAAAIASVRVAPSWQATLARNCLTVVFATAAVLGSIQTMGRVRAFWIGTAVILGFATGRTIEQVFDWLSASMMDDHNDIYMAWFTEQRGIWPFWCAAPVNGLFAVFLHWLLAPSKDAA